MKSGKRKAESGNLMKIGTERSEIACLRARAMRNAERGNLMRGIGIGLCIVALLVLMSGLSGCMPVTGSLSYERGGKSVTVTSDGKSVSVAAGVVGR